MATIEDVKSSDGFLPSYDPNGLGREWWLPDVWTGGVGKNKIVPKVNDHVRDPITYTTWIVDSLHPTTFVPVLRRIVPNVNDGVVDNTNRIITPGPQGHRVYYDKSVVPHRLIIESRLSVGGSMLSYAKIFLGVDTTETGKVIGHMVDSTNRIISNRIPLELKKVVSGTINYTEKVAVPAWTNENLLDNELVTIVFYTADSSIAMSQQAVIVNTTAHSGVEQHERYVTGITLVSPFMSPTDDRLIEFPIHVPINAINLRAKVTYSDGTTSPEYPVNGGKFRMDGLDTYTSTISSQRIPLTLFYNLGVDEMSADGNDEAGVRVEKYWLTTTNKNSSYAVKLFGVPVWVDSTTGYRMKWYMLNWDRDTFTDVTAYVVFDSTRGGFDPKAYGITQRKSVSLNLRDVSKTFKNFRHQQLVDIVLFGPPEPGKTSWLISQEGPATLPYYGDNLVAARKTNTSVNLSSGSETKADWLRRVYESSFPLTSKDVESQPPVPTHFEAIIGNSTVEVPVDNWNLDISIPTTIGLNSNVYLKFIKKTSTGIQILALAGMIVKES